MHAERLSSLPPRDPPRPAAARETRTKLVRGHHRWVWRQASGAVQEARAVVLP